MDFKKILLNSNPVRLHRVNLDDINLSPKELFEVKIERYTNWFIRLRWVISVMILIAGSQAFNALLKVNFQNPNIILIGFSLAFFNFLFSLIRRHLDVHTYPQRYIFFMIFQIFIDFLAITSLSHFFGDFRFLFLLSYCLHLILASIFLNRRISFYINLLAFFMASIPLYLELINFTPKVILSSSRIFSHVAELKLFQIYLVGIFLCFSFIWFVTSEMSYNIQQREKILLNQNRKLLEMDQEKNKLTVRATHELKAPFAAITSYLYTLRDGYCGELTPKAQRTVLKMIDRCDQLTDKITDIIHLSNLKTSIFNKKFFKPVDLTSLLKTITEKMTQIIDTRNIKIDLILPDSDVFMNGYEDHIKTMLSNLIINAINYSKDNGLIEIKLETKQKDLILSIKDNGIGISEEAQKQIFDEYYRSREAARHNPKGSGLGLAIVSEIIKLHEGKIFIKTQIDKGTTFVIKFKIRR